MLIIGKQSVMTTKILLLLQSLHYEHSDGFGASCQCLCQPEIMGPYDVYDYCVALFLSYNSAKMVIKDKRVCFIFFLTRENIIRFQC